MKSKKIILMCKSEIGLGKMAPTAHGEFSTVKEAEVFASKNIKQTPWVVAHEIVRETKEGEEVSYEYLTNTVVPRGNFS